MARKLIYLFKVERDTLYISPEHEVIMLAFYFELDGALVSLRPSQDSYRLLHELIDVITDYSNSFAEERDLSFNEWLRIIPTNLTYAIAGFIAGLKQSDNTAAPNIGYSEVLKSAARCLTALNKVKAVND